MQTLVQSKKHAIINTSKQLQRTLRLINGEYTYNLMPSSVSRCIRQTVAKDARQYASCLSGQTSVLLDKTFTADCQSFFEVIEGHVTIGKRAVIYWDL